MIPAARRREGTKDGIRVYTRLIAADQSSEWNDGLSVASDTLMTLEPLDIQQIQMPFKVSHILLMSG